MALTTNLKTQNMGVANMAVGQVVTDAAAAAAATFDCGFVPRHIVFENITDSIKQEWYEGMAAISAVQTIAAGTRTLSATTGPTLGTDALGTATQFTMPAATMVASKTFRWVAHG